MSKARNIADIGSHDVIETDSGGVTITGNITSDSAVATSVDINGGTIDGTVIGGSTPAAISGTTGTFSGNLTVDTNTLFVDASTNRVAVGTSDTSQAHFTVRGPGTASATSLFITNIDGTYNPYLLVSHDLNGVKIAQSSSFGGSASHLSFDTGGVAALSLKPSGNVFNEGSTANMDFRVESDAKTHMLFVDAGSNRTVIGGDTAWSALTINTSGDGYKGLVLTNTNTDATAKGGVVGGAPFSNTDSMWTAFGLYDNGAYRRAYIGGGGWSNPEATQVTIYTADTYDQTNNAAKDRAAWNNTGVVFNEPGNDYDFRVESDTNTHMLFVDAGTNRVGVMTSAPEQALTVNGNTVSDQFWAPTASGTDIDGAHAVIRGGPPTGNGASGQVRLFPSPEDIDATSSSNVIGYSRGISKGLYLKYNETSWNAHPNLFQLDAYLGPDISNANKQGLGGYATVLTIDGGPGAIELIGTANGTSADQGQIMFYGSSSQNEYAKISAFTYGGEYTSGGLRFDIWDAGTQTEMLRLRKDGTVVNETGGDYDFRVESDGNSHALFVDASESTVGINTSSSAATGLNITGANNDSYGQLRIATTGSADAQVSMSTASNGRGFYVDESSTNDFVIYGGSGKGAAGEFRISNLGNVTINGSLSKSSGSFRIPHPIASKTETHDLIHSFVEAPQADNIYRGKVDLVAGQAAVNIDTVAGMTDGTFALLNREIQCFTSNETGWTAVRGSVSGNILTIEAQDNTCTDTISWLVVGERQDQHMYDTDWTDENGKVIVEPLKS